MRKLITLSIAVLLTFYVSAATVTIEKARLVADNYFRHYSGRTELTLKESSSVDYQGTMTCYIFNYESGGFVVVSADDVAVPILAQSDKGSFELIPPVHFWLDAMNEEIHALISRNYDNNTYTSDWQRLTNNQFDRSVQDVGPLLSTTWDQGQWYNYYCPPASGGQGGKAWAGCVATAMGQIMKYYNYPAKGFSSVSYYENDNGILTANFGNTTYAWSSMGNTAASGNYQAIATLLYHLGVSVYMDYGGSGSGAYSEDVIPSLSTYFNYDPSTMKFNDKANYSAAQWVALLKADLDLNHPVYYAGSTATNEGHAWVCDGYRSSDDKFHMNWGWSGTSNGYFAVTTNISAGGWTFTKNFRTVTGIQPQPLFVRINDIRDNQLISKNTDLQLSGGMVDGNASVINLYLDDNLVYSTNNNTFNTNLDLTPFDMKSYTLKAEAISGDDTAFHIIPVSISEWETRNSSFSRGYRGLNYIHAVDSMIAWGVSYDGSGNSLYRTEFSRTTDGGKTWTSGEIIPDDDYGIGNISAVNENIAWATVYYSGATQTNLCGVYKTTNGGSTWTHLPGVLQGSASFADNVYFWNENEGICHGDVTGTGTSAYFEIYTTSDGGATWTRVPKANIGGGANPASGEGGWTSVIDAIGDSTVMFGSNKAKLYISHDRGYNWTISATGITPATNGGINIIAFKDDMNGLVAQTATTVVVKETHDGGATWQTVTPTGDFFTNDFCYVPGTENTFVSTGASTGATGASYSTDGGHSWTLFEGTESSQFLATDFADSKHGWAGTFEARDLKDGMFRFTGEVGVSGSTLAAIQNLSALIYSRDVYLSWSAPAGSGNLLNYNIYRNDTLIGTSPASLLEYADLGVANGQQTYCVTAVYDLGESEPVCAVAWITVGTNEAAASALKVYPNPATGFVMVESAENISRIRILNMVGNEVYHYSGDVNSQKILTSGMNPGMYIMQVTSGNKTITRKLTIK